MLGDDPRRIGHALTVGRTRLGIGPVAGNRQRYGTSGYCACDPRNARFKVNEPPSKGGLSAVRGEHERHIVRAEGPALPELTRAQRTALLSYRLGPDILTSGKPRTVERLARLGLVTCVSPVDGWWRPTEAGHRVIRLLRRAQDEAARRAAVWNPAR